jgi:hypothetical protein
MKRQNSAEIKSPIRFLAVALMAGAVFFNSVFAVAEGPIPFNAMMQSASAPTAIPPGMDANGASKQLVQSGKVSNAGKAEIGTGIFLVAAGAASLAITGLFCSGDWCKGNTEGKAMAGYAAGAAATAGGVTLIILGSSRRAKKVTMKSN